MLLSRIFVEIQLRRLSFSYYNSFAKVKQMMTGINRKYPGNVGRQRHHFSGIPERYQCIIALTTGDGLYMVDGLYIDNMCKE